MSLTTTLAVCKLVFWCAVLFGWLAPRLFGASGDEQEGAERRRPSLVSQVLKMAFAAVIIVHGLSLLGALDTIGVALSLSAILVGRSWSQRGRWSSGLASLNDSAHAIIFDLLDNQRSFRQLISESPFTPRRVLRRFRGEGGVTQLALGTLALGTLCLRLPGLLSYPYPVGAREEANVHQLKTLSSGLSALDAYYPTGAHALALLLNRLALLDEVLLWKALGPTCAVLTCVAVYGAVVHAAGKSARLAALFAGGLSGVLSASTLTSTAWPDTEVHPWNIAAALLPLACVVMGRYVAGNQNPSATAVVAGSAVLAFIHPLSWLLLWPVALAMIMSKAALARAEVGRSLGVVMFLIAGSLPAIALGMPGLVAGGLRNGPLSLLVEMPAGKPFEAIEQWPLLVAGAAASLLLLMVDRRGGRMSDRSLAVTMVGAAYLGTWSVTALPRLGLAPLLSKEGLGTLTPPLACVTLGLAARRVQLLVRRWPQLRTPAQLRRWRPIAVLVSLGLLSLLYQPRPARAGATPEPVAILRGLAAINRDYVAGTWTVIAHPALNTHTRGRGWHMDRQGFLKAYEPASYRWDPRRPDLAVPSTHLFIFVEKTLSPALGLSDEVAEERLTRSQELHNWCDDYMREHDDMKLYDEQPSYLLFHLQRTRDTERRVLDQIYAESH